jgi:hypothetical protein
MSRRSLYRAMAVAAALAALAPLLVAADCHQNQAVPRAGQQCHFAPSPTHTF